MKSVLENQMHLSYQRLLLVLILVCSCASHGWAVHSRTAADVGNAGITVTGVVRDTHGEALPGVAVYVKNGQNATITNIDGVYVLSKVSSDAVVVFSFVGMQTQEIQVKGRTKMDVTLIEATVDIEEVVVTAFAKQKRVNVTGAISTVSGKDIMAAPVANITNALVGNTPGVSGLQTSGEPGRNATNIRIRGISTYGNSAPLIVIDGVEQPAEQAFSELNAMDPNEILGISILKDASSTAVYGIRSANGVIIVTTKRGSEGRPVISFSANYGFTKASNMQRNLSSYDWASMRNEAIQHEINSNASAAGLANNLYSATDLWKFQNGRDYTPDEIAALPLSDVQKSRLANSPALYYGSKDLYGDMFGAYAPQAQVNVSISGGTERVKYYTSFGYFSQDGINKDVSYHGTSTGSQYQRYNFRSNFDIKLAKNLRVSLNLAGQFGTTQGPGNSSDPFDMTSRYTQLMQFVYESNPFMSPGVVDGHLIKNFAGVAGSAQNPLAVKTNSQIGDQNAVYNLLTSGSSEIYNSLLDNTLKVEYDLNFLLKGLKIHGTVNYQDDYSRVVTRTPALPIYYAQRNPTDPSKIDFFGGEVYSDNFQSTGTRNWNKLYIDAGIDWSESFNKHNITALALYKASKYYMPYDTNNTNTPSGIVGLVGRVTYNYDDRYMAEFNVGYNGTEQFAKGKRFGLFPAYSIGWVPTNEAFFPENKYLTFLKFRLSYGEVGNDQLGNNRRYLYLPNTYLLNQGGYWWGSVSNTPGDYYNGVIEGTLGNPNITWEKAKKYDIGIEARFFGDRLSVMYDWFKEKRTDILTTLGTIPGIYGVDPSKVPPGNVGRTKNEGFELVVGWNDRIGKVGYSIEGNLSHARNVIEYKAEAPNPYYWMNETGYSIGQRFGYKSDGLYNTLEELANRPYVNDASNQVSLGDIRYVDLNGDGVINNKDMAPIGYPNFPEYHYGIKLGLNYRGFDVNMLFSGTANGSFYVDSKMATPYFKNAGNAWQWMYDGRWTAERYAAGENITYPRATYNATPNHNNFLVSDYWMKSNNFFKLKNIEIGYTFADNLNWLKKAHISSLRVYLNGNNLITFKNEMKDMGIDPETTDGTSYIFPLTRVFNLGVNVKF